MMDIQNLKSTKIKTFAEASLNDNKELNLETFVNLIVTSCADAAESYPAGDPFIFDYVLESSGYSVGDGLRLKDLIKKSNSFVVTLIVNFRDTNIIEKHKVLVSNEEFVAKLSFIDENNQLLNSIIEKDYFLELVYKSHITEVFSHEKTLYISSKSYLLLAEG